MDLAGGCKSLFIWMVWTPDSPYQLTNEAELGEVMETVQTV